MGGEKEKGRRRLEEGKESEDERAVKGRKSG